MSVELLGPTVYPVPPAEDEDEGEQKKRAVKVASKMFSVSRLYLKELEESDGWHRCLGNRLL